MVPVDPKIPGHDTIVIAKEQPQYVPLPAVRFASGLVVAKWKLTWRERIQIFLTGRLWHCQQTYNRGALQPMRMSTRKEYWK